MSQRLNPIAWMEGMFLRPHHFQHHDLYHEALLHYHLRAIDPFHWGVRELKIDQEALSDHRISITNLDAVLPGGTLIRSPGNAVVETREFDPTADRIDIFVGVRHWSPGDANSSSGGETASKHRYELRTHTVPDLQRGGYEADLTLAHPNVRVFTTGEENLLELHDSIRIGQIIATGEQSRPFDLNPRVSPPLLAAEAWPPLFDQVAQIANQMAARIRVVVGRTTTLSTNDLPKYWTRYTLSRLTPVLRHHISTGCSRPFDLYTSLLEAASALSTFQTTEAIELPAYDHNDPMPCFESVIQTIGSHLEGEVPDRFTAVPLAWQAAEHIYATDKLNTQLVDPRNAVFLGIKAQMDAKELAKWVVDQGKAGSQKGVKTLTLLNVEGLRIEHLPGAPTDIESLVGFEYFKVDTNGAQWNKVREEFSFGVSLGRLEGADVRLYVVTPEG